jgi:hypothetical protein
MDPLWQVTGRRRGRLVTVKVRAADYNAAVEKGSKSPHMLVVCGALLIDDNPDETRQFGLLIRSVCRHGTRYVEASIAMRKQEQHAPLGCGDFRWEWPEHLAEFELNGLGIYGFVSNDLRDERDGLLRYIGDGVEYRDVSSIEVTTAVRMAKTLRRVGARLSKDRAYEPGDRLRGLAKALRLEFVCEDRGGDRFPRGSNLRWLYLDVGAGRNRFREMIEEARRATTAARFGNVLAKVAS